MAKFPGATQYPVRWWGFPTVHAPRRIKPTILLVVHITGNSRLPSAEGEAAYSNRDGSTASFTFVTNRDGSIVQCLDPETETPWTNGDINDPNTRLSTIEAMNTAKYSANEYCWMTCENVGYEPNGHPITDAQVETLAQLTAWGSAQSGIPISRETVIGHRDINNVTRHNCPTSGNLGEFLDRIITRAKALMGAAEEDPEMIEYYRDLAVKRLRRIKALEERRDALMAELAEAEDTIAALEEQVAANPDLRKVVRRLRARVADIKAKVAAMAADVADD